MKSLILALSLAVCAATLVPTAADAKRLGGGGLSGMQRQMPARTAPDALPARPAQAAPAATPAMAGAAAPKRSWMGPIAGLAAGLGLAALMSHLGMGAEFANMIMLALLAVAAVFAVRFLMRRFGPQASMASNPMRLAGASASGDADPLRRVEPPLNAAPTPLASGTGGSGWGPGAVAAPLSAAASFGTGATSTVPADFDSAGFERIAKMIFIRMQTANDSGDLVDLRAFTTPEMFASVRLELQERGPSSQHTDVAKLDAEVIDVAAEPNRQIVSVRFHGLIQEAKDAPVEPFDEIWHLVKPADGSREWAIAGIQQAQTS